MELIYIWIERYRNIEKCGFHLSSEFTVEVINGDEENKDNDSYILECNKIAIQDDFGQIKYAIHRKFQHSTLILKFNKGKIIQVIDDHKLLLRKL